MWITKKDCFKIGYSNLIGFSMFVEFLFLFIHFSISIRFVALFSLLSVQSNDSSLLLSFFSVLCFDFFVVDDFVAQLPVTSMAHTRKMERNETTRTKKSFGIHWLFFVCCHVGAHQFELCVCACETCVSSISNEMIAKSILYVSSVPNLRIKFVGNIYSFCLSFAYHFSFDSSFSLSFSFFFCSLSRPNTNFCCA